LIVGLLVGWLVTTVTAVTGLKLKLRLRLHCQAATVTAAVTAAAAAEVTVTGNVAMYRESRRRAKASLPQPFARPASPWRASCATIAIGCAPSAPSSRHARRSADPMLCEVSVMCVEMSLDGHAVSAATPRTAQAAPSDRFSTLFDRRVDGHVASGRSPPSLLPKLLPRLLTLLLPLIFMCAPASLSLMVERQLGKWVVAFSRRVCGEQT